MTTKEMAPTTEAKPPTKQQTRRQRAMLDAKQMHEEWIEDFGDEGDIISDAAYRSHVMGLLRMIGLDENLAIEATQIRRACGLEPLQVVKLAFDGTLKARVEQSRDEVADKTIENRAEAEKELLKKRQRSRI